MPGAEGVRFPPCSLSPSLKMPTGHFFNARSPLWVNKKAAYCGFFVAWGRALELPVVTGIPVGISGSSHTQQEPIVLQEVKVVIERERRGVTALRLAFLAFIISMIN